MRDDYLGLFRERKLALIMSLPMNRPAWCRAAFEAGADAVKVHINVDHRASGTHFGRLAEEREALEAMLAGRQGPMGLVLGGSLEQAAPDAEAALEMPFSFYSVYAHHMPAWAIGRRILMAACDASYSMDEIRAMPAVGADVLEASVIPGREYGQPLSMRDLARYRAIAQAVDAPVVVPTQRAIQPKEVGALIRAGVRGLMIGAVVTGQEEDSIARAVAAFRKAIDEV
ncbi:MAG: hypothetical protein IKO07_04935 [Clostridia bacterium]|nr:hypothetical protein [Clostridia bacterium]